MRSKLQKRSNLRRAFTSSIIDHARKIAAHYQIVLLQKEEGWYGRGLELPLTMGDGKTRTECIDSTREALVVTVAYLLEKGEQPPVPTDNGERV